MIAGASSPTARATAKAASMFRTLKAPTSGIRTRPTGEPRWTTVNRVPSGPGSTSVARQSASPASPNVSTRHGAPSAISSAAGLSAPTSSSPRRGSRATNRRTATRIASKSA